MEQGYRQADMIELHDSGYIIMRRSAPDSGENGWREFEFLGGHSLVVDGDVLIQILKHLEIEFSSVVTIGDGKKKDQVSLSESRFAIRQEMTTVGTGVVSEYESTQIIAELSALIEAPNLLQIKVKFQYNITGDPPTVEYTEKHVTYSGRFTVWWSREVA